VNFIVILLSPDMLPDLLRQRPSTRRCNREGTLASGVVENDWRFRGAPQMLMEGTPGLELANTGRWWDTVGEAIRERSSPSLMPVCAKPHRWW